MWKRLILFGLLFAFAFGAAPAATCAAGYYDQCGVCGGTGSTCVCPVPATLPTKAQPNNYCNPTCYPQTLNNVMNQPNQKIVICHGTASKTNPYVVISVAAEAVNGHFSGTAPGHGPMNFPDIFLGHPGAFNFPFDCGCQAVDLCPLDPNKMFPGLCGCGFPDIIDPNTGQPACPCNYIAKDTCEIGCKCFVFRLLGVKANGTHSDVTFSVKNQCTTPTTYIAIAANSVTRISPAAPSNYPGHLGTYAVTYTGPGTDPLYDNGFKFTPSDVTGAAFANGASDNFTVTIDGFNPTTTTFLLMGHTGATWEPFTLKQDPACQCALGCAPTCPLGYSVASNCKACGDNNPGFMYWCDPTGSNDNPYRLIEVPVNGKPPTTGFAPGTTDAQGYPLSCTCQRNITLCPNNCNGHGTCNTATGTCTCDPGFPTPACASPNGDTCPELNYCSGNGRCINGTCNCTGAYTGLACTDLPPVGCIDYSSCATCSTVKGCVWCQGTTGGATCQSTATCPVPVASCGVTIINYQPPACPDACSGHGTCDGTRCICQDGWTGINCGAATLTIGAQVGIGLGAGIVAAIVIGVIAFVALTVGGAVGAYRYTRLHKDATGMGGTNPLYNEEGRTGTNPLYRITAMFKR